MDTHSGQDRLLVFMHESAAPPGEPIETQEYFARLSWLNQLIKLALQKAQK